jgi:hypothetical protein
MTEYRWRKSSRSTGSSDCVEVALTGWRKSSHSTGDDSCVEVALVGSGAVRDSKNPTGPILTVDLSGLLTAIKGGRLDGSPR